jgi:nucleoside-diphosphate-sugar epimerase
VDEKHPIRPVDVNGINKVAGEWYHVLYNNVYGLRACVLRLTNTIGPRMRVKDARQTFVGIWIRRLIEGMPIEVWGGDQLRDLNDVEDVVDALILVAGAPEADGAIYNLGSESIVTLRDLATMLVGLHEGGRVEVMPFPADRKRIDIGDFYSDFRLIKDKLGWRPVVSLHDTLARTLRYYRSNLSYYL